MDNYIKELINDIEAGADTRYLIEVNYSMLAARAIDFETWEYADNLILKSKVRTGPEMTLEERKAQRCFA